MKSVYLDFSGWAKLSNRTEMEYIGQDESKPQTITVAEFVNLSHEDRSEYILQDFISAIRDSDNVSYEECSVNEMEFSEKLNNYLDKFI